MSVGQAYSYLYSGVLVAFSILIGAMLIRAVIGPRITDRILSVNMIGTMCVVGILILSVLLDESDLIDIAMIYALISVVSVLIYTAVYLPIRSEKQKKKDAEK